MIRFLINKIHFLDLLISKNLTDLNSVQPFFLVLHLDVFKTAWVKALELTKFAAIVNFIFQGQVKRTDKFLSWNNFPKRVRRSIAILNRLRKNNSNRKRTDTLVEDNDGARTIWLKLPCGDKKKKKAKC